MKTHIIFLLLIAFSLSSFAQTTDELLELHKKNIKDMYEARGVSYDWRSHGVVGEEEISDVLKYYNSATREIKVGILMYTHFFDTLSVVLYHIDSNKLSKLEVRQAISETDLLQLADNTSKNLSSSYYAKMAIQRGVNIEDENDVTLQNAPALASKILLPFKSELLALSHLIIVPTLNLGILPFSALPLTDSLLLIEKVSISIAPSIFELMVSNFVNDRKILGAQSNRPHFPEKINYNFQNALLLANPTYPNKEQHRFPLLPGTFLEIETVTQYIDSGNYILLKEKEATPSNVLDEIYNRDLLYFATHGIASSKNALDSSFLVFARDKSNNFLISSREVMDLRKDQPLNADLVVLSACQSGLGVSHQGGVIGLARAFQIAGANHVVMSLWNINDQETAVLMGFFFENLKKATYLMPHEALRNAILRYRKEVNDDPSVWAAFTIMGVPY